MRADDLKLQELIEFKDGRLSLRGRRLVIHDVGAFALFRKELLEKIGAEDARRIMTRFGYYWGDADAAAMTRIFNWDSLEEWVKASAKMQTMQGAAHTQIKSLEVDEEQKRFRMEVLWRDSVPATSHLEEFGRTDCPVCWALAGYASGYASRCTGYPVYFVERECVAQGDRICSAVGMSAEQWGTELDEYLPYFETHDIRSMVETLTRELRKKDRQLARSRRKLEELQQRKPRPTIEVHSHAYRKVLELASRVAHFDTSLLITGETGVGKEVLAHSIHAQSPRETGPFVAVNCGALPDTLLESELFGHKAGAFTGAMRDRTGYFEEARKGTIFLDEIGDITPATQLKILRVLQGKEIQRLGESKTRKVDVRVIAATNRNLQEAIAEGIFREDLYYRLGVVEIEVPPLRERNEDVLPLARHFVQKLSKSLRIPELSMDAACIDYLLAYAWPGNVRELENAIERAAVLSRDGRISPEHLPPHVVHAAPTSPIGKDVLQRSLEEVEAEHIERVLHAVDGNRTHAAQILGISPSTLWRKLKNSTARSQ